MNKKLILKSVVLPIATLTGITAQAEEVTTTTVTEPVVETATETVVVPTEKEVATAKSEFDADSTAVANQESVVATAQEVVTNQESVVATAQETLDTATATAEESTPQAVAQAEATVLNTETVIAEIKDDQSSAQEALATQQEAVANQEAVVTAQEAVVDSKQDEVSTAQSAVDVAQANLDGTGASEIISAQQQAEANVATATSELATATSELATAQQADSNRATAIETATENVSTAQNAVDTTKVALDNATATATDTALDKTVAQNALTVAQANVAGINTIYVSDEYVEALRLQYSSKYGTAEYNQAVSKLKDINQSLREANIYKSNDNDKAITLTDLNNLSTETLTELSLFASDLVNQIRAKFGTTQTVVTADSVLASDLVTDGYVADGWGWTEVNESGHDGEALDKAGDYFTKVVVGENLNTWKRTITTTTLDLVKSLIYRAMVDYLYNGREWLHASSITGLDTEGQNTYIGADISVVDNAVNVHINDINTLGMFRGHTFDTTPISNSNTSSQLTTALNEAQTVYNQAVVADKQAQATLASATIAYNNAVSELTTAQATLATAQAVAIQTPQAQANYDNAVSKLATAEQALVVANEAVANLTASVQEKQAILANAKATLETKKAELATAQADLATEQTKLAGLKAGVSKIEGLISTLATELANEEANLVTAKKRVADLKNASVLLAQAKTAYDSEVAKLTVAQEALQAELDKLETLKAEKAISEAKYNELLALYNAHLAKLAEQKRQAELAEQYAEIVANNGNPVAVVDEAGKIVSYVDGNEKVVEVTNTVNAPVTATVKPEVKQAVVATQTATESNQSNLPTTGEATSVLGLIGLGLMALAPVTRKRK
ncbi:TPA: SEC10/PgrA surface exclusion domain-containing protein [Streptococcus suis]|nr:SEC10/PgrA surface exclusion domain-containing protein [Streptococcus suis]HEM3685713.1 SEC10/PgrA surface exclusion domain-containing protein [Streptococcus suis]HEM3693340.1 SEC10/PgrA surface exclusion domain-containing protein [Streptococcus suis]